MLVWRKGNTKKKLSVCYSIVYCYNGPVLTGQSTIPGFDLVCFSSLSYERLGISDLHGVIDIVVYFLVTPTSFYLPLIELSLVGLALDLVD